MLQLNRWGARPYWPVQPQVNGYQMSVNDLNRLAAILSQRNTGFVSQPGSMNMRQPGEDIDTSQAVTPFAPERPMPDWNSQGAQNRVAALRGQVQDLNDQAVQGSHASDFSPVRRVIAGGPNPDAEPQDLSGSFEGASQSKPAQKPGLRTKTQIVQRSLQSVDPIQAQKAQLKQSKKSTAKDGGLGGLKPVQRRE